MTPQITGSEQLLKNLTVLRLVTSALPEKKELPVLNLDMASVDKQNVFSEKYN